MFMCIAKVLLSNSQVAWAVTSLPMIHHVLFLPLVLDYLI
jgi:hypothetical protein